VGKEV
jgi:hypothetical protein